LFVYFAVPFEVGESGMAPDAGGGGLRFPFMFVCVLRLGGGGW
jgi:hypothetical protein